MIEKIVEKAKQSNRPVYVFAHNFPDKDAIASSASLIDYLSSQGIPAKYVVLKNIPYSHTIGDIPLTRSVSNGIAVILDTNSVDYSENTLFNGFAPENTFIIDHHPEAKSSDLIEQDLQIPPENVLRDPSASSTCELLLNDFDEKQISSDIATKLTLGLVSDTGCLRYIKSSTLDNLEKLLKLGADYEKVMHESKQKARLSIEVGRASMFLGVQKIEMEDTYGLILPLDYGQVTNLRNNFGLTNPQKSIFKMSDLTHCSFTCIVAENSIGAFNAEFRSFPFFKNLNVLELAGKYQGGGHPTASGANFYSKNDYSLKSIIETIEKEAPKLSKNDTEVKSKFSSKDVKLKALLLDTGRLSKNTTPETIEEVKSLISQGASYDFSALDFRTYEQFMLRNEILSRVPQNCLMNDSPSVSISLSQADYDSLLSKYQVESFDILDAIHAFDNVNIESATLILPTGQIAQIDNNGLVKSYLLSDMEITKNRPTRSEEPEK